MPAINFKKQFAPLVESGAKPHTIRQVWKRPIKPGDTLYLYTGMRTKNCRLLKTSICKKVTPISINPYLYIQDMEVWIGGSIAKAKQLDELYKDDGFSNLFDFVDFFRFSYGLPFEGVIIEWYPEIKVFQVDEYECWAAETMGDALKGYQDNYQFTDDDMKKYVADYEPTEYTDQNLKDMEISIEGDNNEWEKLTFREYLDGLQKQGTEFPYLFSSTEI